MLPACPLSALLLAQPSIKSHSLNSQLRNTVLRRQAALISAGGVLALCPSRMHRMTSEGVVSFVKTLSIVKVSVCLRHFLFW